MEETAPTKNFFTDMPFILRNDGTKGPKWAKNKEEEEDSLVANMRYIRECTRQAKCL